MNIRRLFSGAGLLLLALMILVSTLVADALFRGMRVDLTENRLYTLSDGSRKIVSGLAQPVALELYFSQEATRDALGWRNYARQVEELLEEFVLASGGQLSLKVIDPEPFSEAEDRAAEQGLQAVPLGGGDPVYFGLVASATLPALPPESEPVKKQEVIGFFQPDRQEFLEYDIARIIYQASLRTKPKVGLISGLDVMGGFDMMTRTPKQSWMVMQQIQQLFEVESLGGSVEEIAREIELLILIHPKALPKSTLYAIDQHVLRGGRLLVFVDPFAEQDTAAMAGSVAADRASDLQELFAAWGIAYDPLKFIADYDLSLQVSMEQGMRPVRHLGILQLDQQRFDRTHPILSQLDSINLSTVGHFKLAEGASTAFRPLWQSSQRAMIMDADKLSFLNNPADLLKDFQPSGESYTLAAAISGKVKSAFPDGVPIESSSEENAADSSNKTAEPAAEQDSKTAAKEGQPGPDSEHLAEGDIHVILVADTDVLSDRMWVQLRQFFGQRIVQPFADNGAFFYNSVDNLTGSQDLIGIRNRGRFLRPFTLVESMQRSAEEDFRQKEQVLQQQLEQTERKLVDLQQQRDDSGNMLMLSPEQEAEVARFQQEKLRIRRDLRDVQHQLNRDIERLDLWLKLFNILLVPLLLTLVVLMAAVLRRRRRNQARLAIH